TPLDLSSKLDNGPNDIDHHNSQNTHKNKIQVDNLEKVMPSETESRPASCEFSPQSSNHGSLAQSIDSPYKETINSHKCSEDTSDHQHCEKCVRHEDSDFSSGKDSENSCQFPYTYCNLPYQCALPNCTKECSLEEVPLDLSATTDQMKENTSDTEKISENANVNSEDSEAVERGMLYQLLKNKTSK
ncbi:metastasis-associated protein MTA3, partial [Caerostris extrusa]